MWSPNSGRVQEKMGVNTKKLPGRTPVSFVIIDNHLLTENGVRYFCALSKEFVLVTSNADHPAFRVRQGNLHIVHQSELSLVDALAKRKSDYGCQRLTIQTGGTLNGLFLREKLLDYIDLVVAPVLVGGKGTSTLIIVIPNTCPAAPPGAGRSGRTLPQSSPHSGQSAPQWRPAYPPPSGS